MSVDKFGKYHHPYSNILGYNSINYTLKDVNSTNSHDSNLYYDGVCTITGETSMGYRQEVRFPSKMSGVVKSDNDILMLINGKYTSKFNNESILDIIIFDPQDERTELQCYIDFTDDNGVQHRTSMKCSIVPSYFYKFPLEHVTVTDVQYYPKSLKVLHNLSEVDLVGRELYKGDELLFRTGEYIQTFYINICYKASCFKLAR